MRSPTNLGAFVQVTYNAPGPVSSLSGNPSDQFNHTWTWDNADFRFAGTTNIGGVDLIYGITANNSPTVQDPWNTTPAWTFPYAGSTLAATPGAKTIIEGAFAAHVGGVGAYTMINDMLYLELTGYQTLQFDQQNSLGLNPFGTPGLFNGVAPYWRVAFEPHWGPHIRSCSAPTARYSMSSVDRSQLRDWERLGCLRKPNKFTDIGVDSQYQYQGSNYWVTLRGNYLREFQRLDSDFNTVLQRVQSDQRAQQLRLRATFTFGGDNRIVLTGQYFNVWGTADPTIYSAAIGYTNNRYPNSNGWMAELAYIPFGASKSLGLAVVQRQTRSAIYLLQQVQWHHGRRPRQQHPLPPCLVCHVSGIERSGDDFMNKRIFLSAAGLALTIAGPALAADMSMPVKASFAQRFTWTSCYLGAHRRRRLDQQTM